MNYYRWKYIQNKATNPRLTLTNYSGGEAFNALGATQIFGICEDRKFSSYQKQNAELIFKIDDMANRFSHYDGPDRRDKIRKEVFAVFPEIYRVFPMTPVLDLVDAFDESNPDEFPLAALSDRICQGERITMDGYWISMSRGKQGLPENLNFINSGLRRHKPIAISYNADMLRHRENNKGVNHISSIVGSREVNGKCEYLLRNSWGEFAKKSYSDDVAMGRQGDYIWLKEDFVKDMGIELFELRGKNY